MKAVRLGGLLPLATCLVDRLHQLAFHVTHLFSATFLLVSFHLTEVGL
jgi:hypothetical protein